MQQGTFMYCNHCGKELVGAGIFCQSCGTRQNPTGADAREQRAANSHTSPPALPAPSAASSTPKADPVPFSPPISPPQSPGNATTKTRIPVALKVFIGVGAAVAVAIGALLLAPLMQPKDQEAAQTPPGQEPMADTLLDETAANRNPPESEAVEEQQDLLYLYDPILAAYHSAAASSYRDFDTAMLGETYFAQILDAYGWEGAHEWIQFVGYTLGDLDLYYAFHSLSGAGTPELIIGARNRQYSDSPIFITGIYSIQNGRAVSALQMSLEAYEDIAILPDNSIEVGAGRMGGYDYQIYTFDDDRKLVLVSEEYVNEPKSASEALSPEWRLLSEWNGHDALEGPQQANAGSGISTRQPVVFAIESSSTLYEAGYDDYSAENVCDGSTETAWVEGADGHGIGETLTLHLETSSSLTGLTVQNGYWKSAELLQNNSRVKRLRVHFFDGTSEDFTLQDPAAQSYGALLDSGGEQLVFAQPHITGIVQLEILEVYEGDHWQDTCVTGLALRGDPGEGHCGSDYGRYAYGTDVRWSLNYESGLLTIAGTGPMSDFGAMHGTWAPWFGNSIGRFNADPIRRVYVGDGVTSIGSFAFRSCGQLTDVSIPASVTRIADNAFMDDFILVEDGNIVVQSLLKVTIHGIAGSYAQQYALNNGLAFVPMD